MPDHLFKVIIVKKTFFLLFIMVSLVFSISAQDKYGLVIDNNKVLQPKDTISLAYPSVSVFIFCELFDANNNVVGQIPVEWSMSGNLTVLDTPIVSQKVIVNASRSLIDQRGYISASALESGAQWINNKVFIKIKGKNSHVLQTFFIPKTQTHDFKKYDVAGRVLLGATLCPSGLFIMRDALEKIQIKDMVFKSTP